MRYLVRFDFGLRDAFGEEVRLLTESDFEKLNNKIGSYIYLGEIEGKHSEVSGDFEKGFVALEKNITPLLGANVFPSTTLLVEYNDNNINYGMRMSIVPDLKLNLGRSDHKTFIGLTYAK